MADLEAMKRSRAHAKGILTKAVNSAQDMLHDFRRHQPGKVPDTELCKLEKKATSKHLQ